MKEGYVYSGWVDILDFGHAYIVTLPISLFPKLGTPGFFF